MEPQNLQNPTANDQETGKNSSFLCRQSSTRWTPTTDQIRILKDLYYNNGLRSPSAEQIQRISARLRQYGKIEGKNVFYWFQNHKARERQKKRFTCDNISMQYRNGVWKNEEIYNKLPNVNSGEFFKGSLFRFCFFISLFDGLILCSCLTLFMQVVFRLLRFLLRLV